MNVRSFALAGGIVWGAGVMFLGWIAAFNWGRALEGVFASLYIGYGPSFLGGVIGGVWAFFDGLIAAALIAWLYNILSAGRR
jgi:hypothetical protein